MSILFHIKLTTWFLLFFPQLDAIYIWKVRKFVYPYLTSSSLYVSTKTSFHKHVLFLLLLLLITVQIICKHRQFASDKLCLRTLIMNPPYLRLVYVTVNACLPLLTYYLFISFSYLISFTYFRHASPNAIRRAKLWQSSVFSTCTPKTISPRPQERRRTIGGEEHGVLCIMRRQCVYTCLARQSPSNEIHAQLQQIYSVPLVQSNHQFHKQQFNR